MKLVQIFLPRYDQNGRAFPAALFARERERLIDRFGALTAYVRAPVVGLWRTGSTRRRGDMVIFEVMVRRVDRKWWTDYRYKLQKRFRQKELLVRVQDAKVL